MMHRHAATRQGVLHTNLLVSVVYMLWISDAVPL